MKSLIYTLTLFFFSAVSTAAQTTPYDLNSIEDIIDSYIKRFNIPSLVVGIVDNQGLQHVISRGEKQQDSGLAVDENTGYQIASLSKTFTSIVYNSLFEAGDMNVLDSVSTYLRGDIPGEALEKYSRVMIGDFQTYMRLKDFLQHRAGLPHNGASIPPTPNGAPMLGGYSEEGLLNDLAALEINHDMLNKFSYSNFGFAVLGHILENATGKTYEDLLKQYVTDPYQMSFTTSVLNDKTRSKLATPYDVGNRKKETKPWEMGKAIPAGGILSNVSDLSRLMTAQMKDYQEYLKSNQATKLILTADKKQYSENASYGYGFFETQNMLDSTVVQFGHGGDVDGFGSFYEIYPTKNVGLVMLTSSGGIWFNELKNEVEKRLIGQPAKEEVKLSKDVLKRYVGKYDFGNDQIITIFRRGGRLMTATKGRSALYLYAQNETTFSYRAFNSEFKFELDDKGKVTKVVYTQNGTRKIYPKRIK